MMALTHGYYQTGGKIGKMYRLWYEMNQRCRSKNNQAYHRYGARGIQVCLTWRISFEEFLQDMGYPPKGMTLERKDNNGDYTPDNCEWKTRKDQARNRRSNRIITFQDKTQCLAAWAEQYGIHIRRLHARLKKGWSIKHALSTPVRKCTRSDHE